MDVSVDNQESTCASLPLPAPPPEHCPGANSENAGKSSACDGCPNQSVCSTTPKEADPDLLDIQLKLARIKHKIAILSGKGGVGKSTFTTQLAFMLAEDENVQVGVLDLDICGPSIPRMTGVVGERLHASQAGWSPVYPKENLAVVSISFMLEREDSAVIWRGPKKNSLIKQFIKDVDWGDTLDYLLIDTPPGTSDEHLSLAQYLVGCDGAILITTPQQISIQDVRKEVDFCRKVKMPILGLVENMSGFVCPSCKCESKIFTGRNGQSGSELLAVREGIEFLGSIPLDPSVVFCGESGKSVFDNLQSDFDGHEQSDIIPRPTEPLIKSLRMIVEKIVNKLSG